MNQNSSNQFVKKWHDKRNCWNHKSSLSKPFSQFFQIHQNSPSSKTMTHINRGWNSENELLTGGNQLRNTGKAKKSALPTLWSMSHATWLMWLVTSEFCRNACNCHLHINWILLQPAACFMVIMKMNLSSLNWKLASEQQEKGEHVWIERSSKKLFSRAKNSINTCHIAYPPIYAIL